MKTSWCAALLTAWLVLVPVVTFAQSTIAGIVSDTSGAVLPGVTVEAASDALIEKVRSAVTDGNGQYRIVDLRPGTYTVTFTLAGFSTFKRDALELLSDFVATVNGEMRVGTLEETITVTGESPVVDVQSARRQQQLNNELIEALPTAQGFAAIATLMPSFVISGGGNNNVQLNTGMIVFGGRGGRGNEGIAQTDGIGTGAAINGGGVSGYGRLDTSQEVVMTSTGGLGDVEVGGPIVNLIPRTGGNRFEHRFQGSGLSGGMQGSNYTQALKDAGLRTPAKTRYQWDTSLSNSGPLLRDQLWFFYATRYQGNASTIPGMFYNRNAGDPTKWLYDPDFSRPAQTSDAGSITPTLRLTWQATRQHRIGLFWDAGGFKIDRRNYPYTGVSATSAPETGTINPGNGSSRLQQVKWTATVTSQLLLEAGLGTYQQNWNGREAPGNNRDLIRVVEQCSAGCAANGGIANLTYRGQNWNADWMAPNRLAGSASYVTGTHNVKAGYMGVLHINKSFPHTNNHNLAYRFNNGVPNQLTQNLLPYRTEERTRYDALYIQDQWTRGRMTLQGALRWDHSWSYYPAQQIGPTRFLPGGLSVPDTKGVLGYHDIDPRMGFSYDLFGNGKSAVKLFAGRYLEAAVNGNGNYSELRPISRIANNVTRTWTDANGNFNADCNLMIGTAQDLRGTGGDFCGPWNNATFGQEVPILSYDEQILKGWYNRPADWQITATVQQEILPRVSVEVGYTRRWLQNFTVTDNRAVAATDLTRFSVTAPLDSRLPGGGGYVVEGLYDVNPNKFGQVDNNRAYAAPGDVSQLYNGVDLNISARLRNGFQVQGGTSTGQTVIDSCAVRDTLPEQVSGGASSQGGIAYNPLNPYCHNAPGVTTRATAAGSYVVPKVDVQLAATFTSSPGVPLQANWNVPTATAALTLGRPLSGNAPNAQVNLLEPGVMRSPRVNLLDVRFGKILRVGQARVNVALDVYNILNLDTALTQNFTFVPGGQWLVPTEVLTARTAKITFQLDF